MKTEHQAIWVGGIAIAIIAVLGMWWLAASQNINMSGLYLPVQDRTATSSDTSPGVTTTNRGASDVLSIAKSISSASEFSALLTSTGVSSEIRRTGQYTIFVPTDGALTTAGLTAPEKKRLAQNHIVSGRSIDPDTMKSGTVDTLARDKINFTVNEADGTVRINSSYVIRAYKGSNGMVYLISGYLIPPKTNPAF